MVTPGGFMARKEIEVKTIDNLVANVGGCGPFQIRIVIATVSAHLCAVWGMLLMVFGNYHSDWFCLDGLKHHNDSLNNSSLVNWTLDEVTTKSWTSDTTTDWTLGELDAQFNSSLDNTTTVDSCEAIKTCQEVGFELRSRTVVTEWTLICDMSWAQSFIIFIQMVGVFLGAHYGGLLGDRCGRRIILYIFVAFNTVFNLLAAFSVDWKMFTCFRFLIGLTVGGMLSSCLLYSVEFVDKWWRLVLSSFPIWNVGAATFSVVVLILKNWKHVQIATCLFSLLVFLLGFWVPESMRWLAVHGKVERAKNIAYMMASMNNRPPPNTTPLDIFAKEERKKLRAKHKHFQRIRDMFKSEKYFTLSVKMGIIWVCMSIIYYTISFGMKFLTGDFYVNFIIFSLAEIPGLLFVNFVSKQCGPRLGSLVYFAVIFLACISFVIANFVTPEDSKGTVMYILALVSKSNILAAWVVMTDLATLLYPSEVSSISTDYLNNCARIGAIISPFLLPNITGSLYVLFLILAIFLFICCLLLISIPLRRKDPSEDAERPKSHLSIIMEEETETEVDENN